MRRTLYMALALLLWQGAANAQVVDATGAGELSDEQIVERILEVRRELDALLAALPDDLRREVEGRLAEAGTEPEIEPETEPEGESVAALERPESVAPAEPVTPAAETTSQAVAVSCAEFAPFDTNGDGAISGFDRHWRFFRLWRDDGDGEVEEAELVGLYDAGVRQFSSDLRRYETADGARGDIRRVAGWVVFEMLDKRGGSGTLMVDAGRLSRGGELALVDAAGEPVAGLRRLGDESMLLAGGVPAALACP